MNISDVIRKDLLRISDTVHGGQAWKLAGVEDFSHNLNPLGPPKCIPEIIQNAVSGVDHYPDDNSTELKGVLADHFNVRPENTIVGAGSSDLIRMFPNTFLGKGDKAIVMRPSFAEYAHQCRIAGSSVREMLLYESHDLRIDTDELLANLNDVKAVYICNPNNPTGRIEPKEKILDIVEQCADRNILVFLDETLLELVPSHRKVSCAAEVNRYDNLLVIGSLTKSFAIPGIRIGFGFASEGIINAMDKVRMTWNVGHIEQQVASSLIKDHMGHVTKAAEMMSSEAKQMHRELNDIGFKIGMTDSFFFFNSLNDIGMSVPEFKSKMLLEKIMIRDCGSFGSEFKSYVRFCVKDRERNEMFMEAVKKVINGVK
ncbi:MAG: histidinol-phosphate aminotransferase family protein [Methanomassiliicoccaceae archaeon]|jgi:threonine-phosphate decarboxylase|nr:histidinol-phosphate aminotransferase family protein [Methanomassiliicoccaceae archaeon]